MLILRNGFLCIVVLLFSIKQQAIGDVTVLPEGAFWASTGAATTDAVQILPSSWKSVSRAVRVGCRRIGNVTAKGS
jgi:hypothetical protein